MMQRPGFSPASLFNWIDISLIRSAHGAIRSARGYQSRAGFNVRMSRGLCLFGAQQGSDEIYGFDQHGDRTTYQADEQHYPGQHIKVE